MEASGEAQQALIRSLKPQTLGRTHFEVLNSVGEEHASGSRVPRLVILDAPVGAFRSCNSVPGFTSESLVVHWRLVIRQCQNLRHVHRCRLRGLLALLRKQVRDRPIVVVIAWVVRL